MMNSPKSSTIKTDSTMEKTNLLPTKVSKNDTAISPENPKGWEGDHNTASRWKAQPVIDWVESLAAATEAGERREGNTYGEIAVAGISLSAPSLVTHTAPWDMQSATHQQPQTTLDARHRPLPLAVPEDWDLDFLQQDVGSSSSIRQISSLAVQIESLPKRKLDQIEADYNEAQHRLAHTFRVILNDPGYESEEEKRFALIALYETTITKLQQIVETSTARKQTSSKSLAKSARGSPEKTKKDLSEYMTAWLRKNFTNPYPDEVVLEELARDCGTTSTTVSNWLINARTRKWRPAIVKASDLKRPSCMLLEDSLTIFDGGTVQPLPEDEGPETKRIKRSPSPNA